MPVLLDQTIGGTTDASGTIQVPVRMPHTTKAGVQPRGFSAAPVQKAQYGTMTQQKLRNAMSHQKYPASAHVQQKTAFTRVKSASQNPGFQVNQMTTINYENPNTSGAQFLQAK